MEENRSQLQDFRNDGIVGLIAFGALILGIFLPDYYQYFLIVVFVCLVFVVFSKIKLLGGVGRLSNSIRRVEDAEGFKVPSNLPSELSTFVGALEMMFTGLRSQARDTQIMTDTLRELVDSAETSIINLTGGFSEQSEMIGLAADSMQQMSTSLKDIAQNVETLAESAEESSSSILEMTTTNEEVAENMVVMGNSVRETVSSIDEMAFSIKEAAGNIDALSATAEGTSSAMTQMDTSIDQVRTNANETAEISADVSKDAEHGVVAISKTLEAINRIKGSSQITVEVISSLGQKIEEIGQILNVIDDVAEQTNLLALNAAIIAAQAGEYGKGFAVVADEIKELAERSGVSTKEIAELIKTIQAESRNAITAVELGNTNVDEGVSVSIEAEQVLKQILSSSGKSTEMMNAIARGTEEQSRGSKQVTDAISQIAETVQQIAAATSEQARGSEMIISGAEKMRSITQHVERSTIEQAKGGRQVTRAIESISKMVNQLNVAHRVQQQSVDSISTLAHRIQQITEGQRQSLEKVEQAFGAVKKGMKS